MWNWISKANDLQKQSATFAIVTTIISEGSTPRDSGTKMIVTSDKNFYGTIGGGLLEEMAINKALTCITSGTSEIIEMSLKVGF